MRIGFRPALLLVVLSAAQLSWADEPTCPNFSGTFRLENADTCVNDLRRDSPVYINFFPSNLMVSPASVVRIRQSGCDRLTLDWSHPSAPGSPTLYHETVEQNLAEGIYRFEMNRYSSSTVLHPGKSKKSLHVKWGLTREADDCVLYRLKLREQGWAVILPYIKVGTTECRFIPIN